MSDPLLIIEDNEQNFYLMRFLLEKNGFAIIGAETDPKGIEAAGASGYIEKPINPDTFVDEILQYLLQNR